MKTEFQIEDCKTPYCVIHAPEKTDQLLQLIEKINMMDLSGTSTKVNGWDGDYCISLSLPEIYRIYSQDKKVFVETEKETLLLKMRLYEFEEMSEKFNWTDFIRISNTEIVNFCNVKKMDLSLSGMIKVVFSNGKFSIVSRRYMNKIRGKLCLKKQ